MLARRAAYLARTIVRFPDSPSRRHWGPEVDALRVAVEVLSPAAGLDVEVVRAEAEASVVAGDVLHRERVDAGRTRRMYVDLPADVCDAAHAAAAAAHVSVGAWLASVVSAAAGRAAA